MLAALPHDALHLVAEHARDASRLRATCRALRAACGDWSCAQVRALARARLAPARFARDRFARGRLARCSPLARCAVHGCGAPRVTFALCADAAYDSLPYCEHHMDPTVLRQLEQVLG